MGGLGRRYHRDELAAGMTKPKPKRTKRYVPREIQSDPVSWAVAGAHKLPTESLDAMFVPINDAITHLKQGRASRDDWNIVCQALNLAEALAAARIGANLLDAITVGQEALHQIALRMLETGSSTCRAAELSAMDESLVMYRAQLQVCTQAELSRAVARVKNLHRSGAMDDVARIYNGMDKTA